MRRSHWLLVVAAVALGFGFARQLRADLAPGPDDGRREPGENLRRRLERLREQAAGIASAVPHPPAAPSVSAAPSTSATTSAVPFGSAAVELARKWAELAATRQARRERHRAELMGELGAHLGDPAVLAEVKLHTTRQAELQRAKFVAQNARQGAARERLLARIDQLSLRENARHRARLQTLWGRSGAPAPSTATSASPPSSASAGSPR